MYVYIWSLGGSSNPFAWQPEYQLSTLFVLKFLRNDHYQKDTYIIWSTFFILYYIYIFIYVCVLKANDMNTDKVCQTA